jgi:PhoD-like phosphatase
MARLVLGPLLRYTGSTQATVWVETDSPCAVEVLGHSARTFHVEGHHYALVVIAGLEPASVAPYQVRLDGERVWPPPGDERPPCAIHTRNHERQARLVFGSCRVGAPERPPSTLGPTEHPEGFGIDALWAFSRRLQAEREPWPDCLILLGDQVYADEVSPETLAFMRARRDVAEPPGEEVADFEEYTRLYRESWSDPDIRWLLSTVPSTMVFDDHDVRDDWNISEAWVEDMRRKPWWEERIVGAFMAYWLYQHIGNLAPPELGEERLLAEIPGDEDGGPRLRRFAHMADRETASSRWAFHRDFGRSRLVVIDSRAARVLGQGRRDMVDEGEWEWIVEHARGDYDHLVLASTLPVFLPAAIHHLEAWNEAVCSGAWGGLATHPAEWLRRALDLEHWAAFQRSFRTLLALLDELAAEREDGEPPATITILGGDVHAAYAAEVTLGASQRSRVHQVVCSPFRNPLSPTERRFWSAGCNRALGTAMRLLARAAGVRPPAARWRFLSGPTFDNSIAVLGLDERAATITIRRTGGEDDGGPGFVELQRTVLSDG